jgi:outer membrane receptor protein involved in Fe transport
MSRLSPLFSRRSRASRRFGKGGLALLIVGGLSLLASAPAHAQNGRVTGVVTDAQSGATVGEVQVYMVGSTLGTLTRSNGRYLILNVPPGSYELRAERIGFQTLTESVDVLADGTATMDFAMTTEALGLDEIVVTGAAGAARRREIGNAIAQINLTDVPERQATVSDLLQAAAPGVHVIGGSSEPAQGKQIRLRGNSSVAMSNQPIIYVDGVRIMDDAFPVVQTPGTGLGRPSLITVTPLDMINPNDIERIEIIKGSAATTLYGTEASAGVIQVFTKRGAAGAPVWTAEVKGGSAWSRKFGVKDSGGDPYVNMGPWICTGPFSCGEYHPGSPFTLDYSLSVRGGRQDLQYFISGGFLDEQGYMTNDSQKKYHTRANFTVTPATDLTIQWNTAYSANALTMTNGQNNAQGITLNAFRAERNYFGTGDPAVLNELMDQQLNQDIERLTTGATITYSPLERLTNRFTVGYDFSSQEHRNLRPYAWRQVPEGALLNNTFQNRVLSFDYVGTYNFELTSSIGSNFSWGGQATGDDDRNVEAFGENFPGAADPTINSAALTQGFESRSKIWNAGFFFQNVFDISDRYFITVGTRVDGNSAFGTGFGLQVYPKASASWIISDESFWPDLGEFKLRAAYGQSGRAPGAFDAVRTWSPAGLAGVPAFVPSNVGNDQVGPEVTEEIEAGFDASWLGDRLTTTFTAYRQTTNDALLFVPQIPSTGFTSSQLTNIGRLQNQGIELEMGLTVLESANWGVDLGGSLTTNHSKVLELGEGIIPTGNLRMDCGPNGDEGCPLRNMRDLIVRNPDEIAAPNYCLDRVCTEREAVDGDRHNYGPNLPTTFIGGNMMVRAPGNITLAANGEFKGGFYMNEAVWSISRSVRSHLCFPWYVDPQNSIEMKDNTPALFRARCNPRESEGYMWKGDFFKLRSVSATIPVDAVFPERVSNATFTLALRNSYLWRKEMPFMDPELTGDPNSGQRQGYGFEESVPAPITLHASLRITF